MLWSELDPEPEFVAALDHAGERASAINQDLKRHWSENLADGCAIAFADEFRKIPVLHDKRIRPASLAAGTEPLTPLGSNTQKRIDVTVADAVLGLEIGVSLKGLNFRDGSSGNYDKNLTGRLYELGDEMRLVHEHLPHAFMAGILYLPVDACEDKTMRANSSFACTILKLRSRTGRLDVALGSHTPKCDAGYVGLYTMGTESEGLPRGIIRFLNVRLAPPRRGRPQVGTTLSLRETVDEIVAKATGAELEVWADPEVPPEAVPPTAT